MAITATLALTGCSDTVSKYREATTYRTQGEYVVTHITSRLSAEHLDETIYNFVENTVEIYTNGMHINTVSVKYNTDTEFKHHVEAYKRVFLEEVEKRGCAYVYGCQAEAKIVEDKVESFKQQIANLKQSANDLQQALKAASEREALLTTSLSEAQNSNQENASEIANLQAQLAQAQTQKSTVSESLAEYEALIRSTLSTEDEGEEQ